MSFSAQFTEAKATLRLATPIIIGQVSQMLMGLTDTYMIGQVGKVPLAASAMAGNIFGIFYIVGIGLFQPLSVLIARGEGAGRPDDCAAFLKHGMALAFAFSFLEMVLLTGLGFFLDRLGQPPEVIAEARAYYFIVVASMLPTFVFQVLRQYCEALHRPWLPMYFMLGAVVFNAFANWVLIYGKFGLPAMGLAGAGWATLAGRFLAAALLWAYLVRARRHDSTWPHGHWLALEAARFREMIRLGVPAAGQLLFEGGAFTAAAIMMGWLGTAPLAAHQIALTIAATTFMFMLGIATAVSIRVGQATGAGDQHRLRAIGFSGLGLCVSGMAAFGLLLFFFSTELARQFVEDPEVVALASQLIVISALFQVFDGAQVVGSGMLRGLSDIKIPTLITFTAYWLIALPGGYLWGVHWQGGAAAIWTFLAIGLACAAVFFAFRFARLTRGHLARV